MENITYINLRQTPDVLCLCREILNEYSELSIIQVVNAVIDAGRNYPENCSKKQAKNLIISLIK